MKMLKCPLCGGKQYFLWEVLDRKTQKHLYCCILCQLNKVRPWKQVIHDRDQVCQDCGTSGSKHNKLTIHHKIPVCQGGSNNPNNLVLLCNNCHYLRHKKCGYPSKKRKKRKKNRRY